MSLATTQGIEDVVLMDAEGLARSNRAKAAVGKACRLSARGYHHVATSEVDYSAEEMEFLNAMESYKKASGHKFPSWSEALNVLRKLGYAKQVDADKVEAEEAAVSE